MSNRFWYGFRLPEKKDEKDNEMIAPSTDFRSGSNHTVASILVSDSVGKKLCDCNLLLRNSGLPHLPGIIFV